jgi:hypothetical protein
MASCQMLVHHRLLDPRAADHHTPIAAARGALPPEHPATGLQNNPIWKCHPLLDRAAASVHNEHLFVSKSRAERFLSRPRGIIGSRAVA